MAKISDDLVVHHFDLNDICKLVGVRMSAAFTNQLVDHVVET